MFPTTLNCIPPTTSYFLVLSCIPDALLLQRIPFTSHYSLGMEIKTNVKSRLGGSCEICITLSPTLMVFQEISGGGDLAQEVQQLESALQQRLTASRATPEAEPNAMTFERKRRLSIALGQLSGDRVADVMRIISEDPYMREKVHAIVIPTRPSSQRQVCLSSQGLRYFGECSNATSAKNDNMKSLLFMIIMNIDHY